MLHGVRQQVLLVLMEIELSIIIKRSSLFGPCRAPAPLDRGGSTGTFSARAAASAHVARVAGGRTAFARAGCAAAGCATGFSRAADARADAARTRLRAVVLVIVVRISARHRERERK